MLKRSAATGKINVLTTNRTTTQRHNDELRNMFFKNNAGKIASLKNCNESQHKQYECITDDDEFRKLPMKIYTKNDP